MNDLKDFIKGMDVSTLIEEERCGAKYYNGGIRGDLLEILKDYGTNSVRLRLWNDPYRSSDGAPYGAGTCNIDTVIELARRAKALGMSVLLDFHYSDFWADPGKQIPPKAWQGLTADALAEKVFEFTYNSMLRLQNECLCPELVQIGNEITNGLLWPLGKKPCFDNIARFVSAGIKAVRKVSPATLIMLHLDNGGFNEMYVEWFDNYITRGEDFDIIGLSYYPFWHGTMKSLSFNMNDMARRYHKKLVIAEVSTGFSTEDYRKYEGLSPDQLKGMATAPALCENLDHPLTPEGQSSFMQDIMELISSIPGGMGFYYWEPGWIPVHGCGWATSAALEYTGEKGPGGNEWANQALFDYEGNALPALKTIKNFKNTRVR